MGQLLELSHDQHTKYGFLITEGRLQGDKKKYWKELVPRELWKFGDRFDAKKASRLPKHSKWDMKIDFKEGQAPTAKRTIYPLTLLEQKAVEEFIEENIMKG